MLWDHDTGQVGDPSKGARRRASRPLLQGQRAAEHAAVAAGTAGAASGRELAARYPCRAYVADMAFGAECPGACKSPSARRSDEAVAALGRDPQSMGIVWQQPCVVAETERRRWQRERLLTMIPDEGVAGLSVAQYRVRPFSPCRSTSHSASCTPRSSPAMHRRWGSCANSRPALGGNTEITREEFFDHGTALRHQLQRTLAGTQPGRSYPRRRASSRRPAAAAAASCWATWSRCRATSSASSICCSRIAATDGRFRPDTRARR